MEIWSAICVWLVTLKVPLLIPPRIEKPLAEIANGGGSINTRDIRRDPQLRIGDAGNRLSVRLREIALIGYARLIHNRIGDDRGQLEDRVHVVKAEKAGGAGKLAAQRARSVDRWYKTSGLPGCSWS